MFNGCSSLTKIDISHFNLDNVQYMQRIFDHCPSLAKGEIKINKNILNKLERIIPKDLTLGVVDSE